MRIMASNKLKLQNFRTNDLVNDGGKQFEIGKSWCDDFFEFDEKTPEVIVNLIFKAIQTSHMPFNNKTIELKLAGVSNRGDRKAYVNGTNGMSQIKDFFINDLRLTVDKNLQDYFAVYKTSEFEYYLYFVPSLLYSNFLQFFKSVIPSVSVCHQTETLLSNKERNVQKIYYGAPGTGKSHEIKEQTEGKKVIRTTFHPDSDYSTFVGAYKPTSVEVPTMTMIGTKAVPVENPDGTRRTEKKIVYEFVPQAFLKAYTAAWKKQDEPYFLIIEEINRGNCAQIFGDLFQLLDRNDAGESEYPVSPDDDIRKFLQTDKKHGFASLTEEQIAAIPEKVRSGEELILPRNLYIWATMNTSDQSLFPIDSAFKRRWDWQYIPISDGKKDWEVEANGKRYDWWEFLQKINDKIGSTTNSEDKKLGYFFCKAKNGIIDAETFVGKVIFYVWNDVFKDFAEEAGDLFRDEDNTLLSFNKFYAVGDGGKTEVLEDRVTLFMQKLGVEPINNANTDDDVIIKDDNQAGNLEVE